MLSGTTCVPGIEISAGGAAGASAAACGAGSLREHPLAARTVAPSMAAALKLVRILSMDGIPFFPDRIPAGHIGTGAIHRVQDLFRSGFPYLVPRWLIH